MTDPIVYLETPEFQKDFRKLLKKFRSLNEDLAMAKKAAIELFHVKKINNQSVFPIPGFCSPEIEICKLKKFACKALKGKGVQSGIRIIYAFYPRERKVELIEIYFKADQENEDRERIKEYLQDHSM
jgi:hypothetical protein